MGTHSYSLNDPVAFDPAYLPHQPVYEPWDDISWVYGFYNETMNFYEAVRMSPMSVLTCILTFVPLSTDDSESPLVG